MAGKSNLRLPSTSTVTRSRYLVLRCCCVRVCVCARARVCVCCVCVCVCICSAAYGIKVATDGTGGRGGNHIIGLHMDAQPLISTVYDPWGEITLQAAGWTLPPGPKGEAQSAGGVPGWRLSQVEMHLLRRMCLFSMPSLNDLGVCFLAFGLCCDCC